MECTGDRRTRNQNTKPEAAGDGSVVWEKQRRRQKRNDPHGARASGHDAQVRGEAEDSTSGPEKNGSAEAQLGVRGRQARSPGVTGSSTRGA